MVGQVSEAVRAMRLRGSFYRGRWDIDAPHDTKIKPRIAKARKTNHLQNK
jgi:hypothetical protein